LFISCSFFSKMKKVLEKVKEKNKKSLDFSNFPPPPPPPEK